MKHTPGLRVKIIGHGNREFGVVTPEVYQDLWTVDVEGWWGFHSGGSYTHTNTPEVGMKPMRLLVHPSELEEV